MSGMISSVMSSTCTQYAIINDTYQMLLCLSFSTGAVDPAAPAFLILPRGLGGPSDCQAATVAARCGVAAFKSWHITLYTPLFLSVVAYIRSKKDPSQPVGC